MSEVSVPMAPDLLGVHVPIHALFYPAEVRLLIARVNDRPKDAVAFVAAVVFIVVDVFVAAVIFIGNVAVAGVVVVVTTTAVAVVMSATGRLEGGMVQISPGGIRGSRSGAVSFMCLAVAVELGSRL